MLDIKIFNENKFQGKVINLTKANEIGKSKKSRVHLQEWSGDKYSLKVTSEDDIIQDNCHCVARESHMAQLFFTDPLPNAPRYHACFWNFSETNTSTDADADKVNESSHQDQRSQYSMALKKNPLQDSNRVPLQREVCIVMDFCPGRSLFQIVRQRKGLPEPVVQSVIKQVAESLASLHTRGYLYIDLKSENVIVDESSGKAHLIDFDLCHSIEEIQAYHQQAESSNGKCDDYNRAFWGTDEYIAPEILQQGRLGYSTLSDWWSLGVLTLEALQGHTPYAGPTRERTFYLIQNRSPEIMGSISSSCRDFVKSLLRHKREYRLGVQGPQEVLSHPFLSRR
mmetsp:Transcript_29087/g.53456  ORF Transcript_29087/g.53456 Transcript_29087/m.53456 type:complete len:339 (-) Transcript_29087:388-1404(-)